MFTIFTKKKLSEDQLANFFVNSTIKLVETGFEDVVEIINNDPEFAQNPSLSKEDSDQFLLIVLAGNIKLLSNYFESIQGARVAERIYRKLGSTLMTERAVLKETIAKYQSWMGRVNHPSKNVHYSMSKGFFFKYGLNDYQTDYFKNMNTPNPIFLKRLDEIVVQFIFDWAEIKDTYRIVE
tara:strand:- start:758 stop:1300 length:543 start_codon:yes stop_codon:yes gene_type:complete